MASFPNNNNYYRQLIMQHFSQPKHKGLLKTNQSVSFHYQASGCVDDFTIELTINQTKQVTDARFDGVGCAISTASIDIYCSLIINLSCSQVAIINQNYLAMLKNHPYDDNLLVDLNAFQNVLKHESRVGCALIISEAIQQILNQVGSPNHDANQN